MVVVIEVCWSWLWKEWDIVVIGFGCYWLIVGIMLGHSRSVGSPGKKRGQGSAPRTWASPTLGQLMTMKQGQGPSLASASMIQPSPVQVDEGVVTPSFASKRNVQSSSHTSSFRSPTIEPEVPSVAKNPFDLATELSEIQAQDSMKSSKKVSRNVSSRRSQSSGKGSKKIVKVPGSFKESVEPLYLPKDVPFVWDYFLNSQSFKTWLLENLVPEHLVSKVKTTLDQMDNIKTFEDLKLNFLYLRSEAIIDLFTSKREFYVNMDGVIVLAFLCSIIEDARANVRSSVQEENINYVKNSLKQHMFSPAYVELKEAFQKTASMMVSLNTTHVRDYESVSASTLASDVSLTPAERTEFHSRLEDIAARFPGQEDLTGVQEDLARRL